MINTVTQQLNALGQANVEAALKPALFAVADRLSSQIFNTGGLAIKAGGGVLVKTVNTVYALADGKYVALSAADMPALTGLNITAGYYNCAVFYVDSAGTTSVQFGREASTAAGVTFPQTPQGKAIIGFVMITYASAFTGNTTALDTATTVYVNTMGALDPSVKI